MPKVTETNNTVRDKNNSTKKKTLWGILVGINNYQDENIANLQFCANDAVGLAQGLQKVATQELPTTGAYFDEVEIIVHSHFSQLYSWSLIRPPQQDKILDSLEILSQAQPQDTVLFYFSGHGFYQESKKDTILCLEETSKNDVASTGLLISIVLDKITNSPAQQQLIWLDACHSGGVASQLIEAILHITKDKPSPNLYSITACGRHQQSFETPELQHGIFTYHLLEGLKGQGSPSLVKIDDLYSFVASQTQNYIKRTKERDEMTHSYKKYQSFKPHRLVAGHGAFILGVNSNLVEDKYSRAALVMDGFYPSESMVKIGQKLAIQGRFAYQPYPNKSESLADSISELLNSSATTTALLYLKGRFNTDEEGVWFVFADDDDDIKISRDWLAEQLRDSPVPQQIIILDCQQTPEIDRQIEPLKQPDKSQCIVAASIENDWLSEKFLEIIEQHSQDGLTATNFIKTIQQAFYQQSIYSSSQRDCYRSESGILNLVLEQRQHLEGIIIDRNVCPYKSLEAFTRKDKDLFFGRESLIDEIITKLQTKHFLFVMGASGSGKSSLVQAGVVPRLLNKGLSDPENACNIWILRPEQHPLQELAKVFSQQNLSSELKELGKTLEKKLTGENIDQNKLSLKELEGIVDWDIEKLATCSDQQLHATGILVINQFEELFTNNSDVEQKLFVKLILNAVQSMKGRLKVIATLRSDFLSFCLENPELGEIVKKEPIFVPSYLTEAEYRQIIIKPAQRVGLAVEPELVNLLVEEVVQNKGVLPLPLLEFTLEQLWQNRVDGKLSLEVYQQKIGGIRQVLQDKADNVYQELTKSQQECAEWIFTQLVRLGEGTEDTRRRRKLSELIVPKYSQELIKSTLDVLIKSRLIVMSNLDGDLINNRQTRENGEPPEPVQLSLNSEVTVEIAHEILIRTWTKLREWLKNNREFCTWQERLNTRIQEWKEGQGELLSKPRLETAQDWRQTHGQKLSSEQENFIQKSEQKIEEIEQKQKRQLWLVQGIILSVIIVVSLLIQNELSKRFCNFDVGEKIGETCFRFIIDNGGSLLFVGNTNNFLEEGVKHFAKENFEAAEKSFENAQVSAPFDPIPRIYYNNARAINKGNSYKLGVVVPVDAHQEVARNMLRGVAYAQNEFNNNRKDSEPLLEIIIANDKNNDKIAKEIAKRLVKKNILGVIGHRSSGSSLAAIGTYHRNGISMISPTSGSTELDNYSPKKSLLYQLVLPFLPNHQDKKVFFRAVASNKHLADKFYKQVKTDCLDKDKKVWVVYDSEAKYSNNFKNELGNKLKYQDPKTQELFEKIMPFKDLLEKLETNQEAKEENKKNRLQGKLKKEINKKIDQGVKCVILIPSTKTTSTAISIVYAYQELSKREKLPNTKKIRFLNNEVSESIQKCIRDLWGGNVSWRTYTSYKATTVLTEALKKLDEENQKITTTKKREIVLNSIEPPDIISCLMPFNPIQENKLCPANDDSKVD